MTESEKIEIKAALNGYSDLLYNQLVASIETAEATLPAELDQNERHKIITNLIKSVFETQQATLKKGFDEVQAKLKDKSFMEELHGRKS